MSLPSTHYLVQLHASAMNYIQSVICFLVWIFGTDSYLFDQIIVLVIHILFLIFLITTAKKHQREKSISYWPIVIIYIYLYYISPIFIFGFFFRISDTIEKIMTQASVKLWISFGFEIVNYFFFLFYIYIDSLFLEPFSFVSTCNLDVYDGKGTMILVFAQTYMCICSNLINLLKVKYIDLIFVTIGITFAFLVVFYRFLNLKHVSSFGDYLEISNILSFPFVLLVHRFVPNSNWVIFYFSLGFHIISILVILLVKQLKVRRAKRIANILLQNTDNNNLPQVISDSFVSTIRILVKTNANPAVFERILQQHHQFGLKTSIVLEIVRFLSVFPEKRKDMIMLLRTLNSKTKYNAFMTYLFHKNLASLFRSSSEENLRHFTELKRNFLVHQSLFWIRRSQKLYFKSLKESFFVTYYYIELKTEIAALMNRFPFDSSVYDQYGEFLLFACGDFDNHLQCQEIASDLKTHKRVIDDPLLHPMLTFSPRIMQFCKIDKKINSADGSVTDLTTTNYTNTNLHVNGSSSTILDTRLSKIHKTESGTEDSFYGSIKVSTLITPSKRNIPFCPIYNTILVFVFLFVFFAFEIQFEMHTSNESSSISEKLNKDVDLITEITANSIISIATNHYLSRFFNIGKDHVIDKFDVPNKLNGLRKIEKDQNAIQKYNKINSRFFYSLNDIDSDFVYVNNDTVYTKKNFDNYYLNSSSKLNYIKEILRSKVMNNLEDTPIGIDDSNSDCFETIQHIVTSSYGLLDVWVQTSYASLTLSSSLFRFFYYALSENRNTCFVFNSITKYIENMTITEFNLIEASIKEINDQINRLSRHIKHQYYIFLFVLSSIAYSIVFILIYLVIVIIQVNSVFKDDDAAIRFLASKEKLSMMVLERTEQSWQILSQFVNDKAALESLKIDPNTTVGISMQPSKFNLNESENNSNKSIMTNTPNTTRTNTPNITRTNTPNTTRTNTPNTTRTSTPNSTVNNSNNNENPDLKITTSASSCVEKSNNLLLSPSNTPSLSLQKTEGSPGVPAAAAPNPSLMMLPRAGRTSVTFTGYPTQLFKSSNDIMGHDQSLIYGRLARSAGQSETDDKENKESEHETCPNKRQRRNSLNKFYLKKTTTTDTSFDINSNENEEILPEIDPLDEIIKSSIASSKGKWFIIFVLIFSSWFFLIVSMILFIVPLNIRSKNEIKIVSTIVDLGNQINSFFHITEIVYYSIIHFDSLTSDEIEGIQASIAEYHYLISSQNSLVKDLYMKEQCLMLQGVVCTSAARIIFRIMRDPSFSTTDEDIESAIHLYMPACLFFSKQLLTDVLYNDLIELTKKKYSVDYCFLALAVLIFLICLHTSIYVQKLLNEGFNSLFHYPESLTQKNLKEKEEANKKLELGEETENNNNPFNYHLPSSVLVVSYVTETDEIYSISENAQTILQRQPQEFISRKFSQTFPLVADSSEDSQQQEQQQQISTIEIREHLMPDKKSKKTFRTSSTKMSHIIKILMIEESRQASTLYIPAGATKAQANENINANQPGSATTPAASNLPNTAAKTESLASKLSYFVPASFAKAFNDDNISVINYTKCIIIMIRIKNNLTFQVAEKFFSILNGQVSNYSSISIMKVDGSIITLSTISEAQPIIPFLFVRDILNDSKNYAKNKPDLFAPECFLLINSQYASGDMKEGIEPFLEFDMPDYEIIEKMFYTLQSDSCFFKNELLNDFPIFEKMSAKCDNVNLNDFSISSIPFPKYISYFSNYI